ncbi:MAG TPA: glycoside hydrolase family 43 protein, partial [Treponema sp.]|nr:glycoside hydrolase family 43 protein [Treponema sp.]
MQSPETYRNPVLRGFNPDPSIVRVGDWYYLATSSFQYFPAIPIYRSADLVEWEPIGHAIDRDEQLDLRGIEDSHGIWAPDLSFHDGRFHLFATLRLNGAAGEAPSRLIRRQMVMTAERAEGPWSDPVFIDIDGIDPSLFVDDDGSSWMLLEPGVRLFPLSADRTRVTGAGRTIWAGTGARCPEGPRMLKRNGWYYAMLAEGGTGYGHRINVARSRSLSGPYEECPRNPLLMQTDPAAPLQRAGHGQLVGTAADEWWCVYLCGRPNGGNFTTLGRETALDPVEWTEDGWFTINGGHGPSAVQRRPALPRPPAAAGGTGAA